MDYKVTIGLEVHVELNTKSKMFCSCKNDSREKHPNVNICPICTAQPGTLPVINKEAVKKVIKTGLALNSKIKERSKFDRKNYFYPDLPKGYQISQYDLPLCKGGFLKINDDKIRIKRIHLEEDTGKLTHYNDPEPSASGQDPDTTPNNRGDADSSNQATPNHVGFRGAAGQGPDTTSATGQGNDSEYRQDKESHSNSYSRQSSYSLVDFNRAGVPLMELVTEPDLKTARQAKKFAQELRLILRYLEVSEADMEQGEMRIEANVSLQSKPEVKNSKLGVKVEIKNLNSFKAVEQGIGYEIERQRRKLEQEKKVVQETRGWDQQQQKTFSQREKERVHDYRYFPEPDLPPLETKDLVPTSGIPELPAQRRIRFAKQYNLKPDQIEILVTRNELGEYFEKVITELENWKRQIPSARKTGRGTQNSRPPQTAKEKDKELIKLASNYILTDLLGLLKEGSVEGEEFLITPENFAELIILIYKDEISSKAAKKVLREMFSTGADPSQIVEEKGLQQITDADKIRQIVKEIISENEEAVQDYKRGKKEALKFLVGKVMEVTKGRADPELAKKTLKLFFQKKFG